MQTWELITGLGSIHDLNLEIYVPCKDRDDFRVIATEACAQFNLNRLTTRFLPVFSDADTPDVRKSRDCRIVERADVILPVSIRPDGHMDCLIGACDEGKKTVNRSFAAEYETRSAPLAYKVETARINSEIERLEDSFIIHWTRTCNTAWPTETLIDYYRAVIESDCYPRSAFATLCNIVSTRVIKASCRNMPGKTATVSFSNCPPAVMAKLMTWRARYRVMSFEPYGIGIEKQTALAADILPVNYYYSNNGSVVDRRHWLSQSRGEKSDWTAEDEYRHLGDMDLTQIDPGKMIIICRAGGEANEMTEATGINAIAFTLDEN